ncbi:AAA family ATPase, partial [Thiolapillus sp.]
MRPLRLKMSAFGPFASTQEIDFSLLGDSPLFLINGPTGSGKTTILDAISYALYDETTGNERQGREMRCDHAADDLLTEVELEFELGRRRYRIRRVPRQERPKAGGAGTTTQQSEAQLWELDAQGGKRRCWYRRRRRKPPQKSSVSPASAPGSSGRSWYCSRGGSVSCCWPTPASAKISS